ncbi:hypothetical protein MHYP_G00359260 [Metynnis hypsauchen]
MKGKRCGGGAARLPRCGQRNGRRIDRAAPRRFSLGGQQKALLSGHSSTQTASPPLYTLARSHRHTRPRPHDPSGSVAGLRTLCAHRQAELSPLSPLQESLMHPACFPRQLWTSALLASISACLRASTRRAVVGQISLEPRRSMEMPCFDQPRRGGLLPTPS